MVGVPLGSWEVTIVIFLCILLLHTEVSRETATWPEAIIKAAQTKPEKITRRNRQTRTNKCTRQRFTTNKNQTSITASNLS